MMHAFLNNTKTKIGVLILIGLICSFCSDSNSEEVTQDPNPNTASPKNTYLALGDSYTIGASVPATDRFPEILVERLKERGIEYNAPRIIARTGWTTGELLNAIEAENIQQNFSLVTLLIGVNNQYRGLDIEEYRVELQDLLQRALVFAAFRADNVRVVSIPDWGVSPFAANRDRNEIAKEIDAFNAVKREETEKLNIAFIDITKISRTAFEQEQFFAVDGLHFSKEMHELWVDEILRESF